MCFGIFYSSKYYFGNDKKAKNEVKIQKAYAEYSLEKPDRKTRIKIAIFDDTERPYYDIIQVTFNNKKINLIEATADGERGSYFTKLEPGDYTLTWTITINKNGWPTTKTFTKTIKVKEVDKYLHILITGGEAVITTS